jgi:hypothetical protein
LLCFLTSKYRTIIIQGQERGSSPWTIKGFIILK